MRSLWPAPLALTVLLASAPALAAGALSDREVGSLKSALDDVVGRSNLGKARASILVQSLEDGRTLYAHDAEELLNPASNVKLFTAAAALARLGPDYRWTTDFLVKEPMKPNGEVKDLWVRGNGDPTLTTEKLYVIVSELSHQGLKTITGNIYVDDSYFDAERVGPGFDQESSDKAYMAPTGALSLNWNAIEVNVYPGASVGAPARVELDPPSEYFTVESPQATTIRKELRGRVQSKVTLDGERQKVEIQGRLPIERPGTQFWRKVDRPDLYFGYTLKKMLTDRGIKVKGKVKPGQVPAEAKSLYSYDGDPLDLAVRKMDKTSSNFIAEQLVKTLGAELKGAPGSWQKGVDAIEDFLEEVGLPRGSYVMKNGSGLNDTNRFSASQVVKLIRYMYKRFNSAPEYLASLGVVGKDGTVRGRMEGTEAAGRIRAKTGTLESVSALSGVAETVGGQRLAFAILVNDYPGKHAQINGAIDDLGVAMAAAGGAIDPTQVRQQMVASAQPQSSPLDELKARVATYASLGKLGNKHNLPFLRTALRTERDPALKAVVAESLYLSDRSEGRALLDAWSTSPEVWGRLKAVSQSLGTGLPVVPSLLDLAAEGSGEALNRTVELAGLTQGDPALSRLLAEGLDQISRNAPDELLAALKAAPPESSRAALDLLAVGNASSPETEADSPFAKALLKAEGGKDPELASYAKSIGQDYATKLALAKAAPKVKSAEPAGSGSAPAAEPASMSPRVTGAVPTAPSGAAVLPTKGSGATATPTAVVAPK